MAGIDSAIRAKVIPELDGKKFKEELNSLTKGSNALQRAVDNSKANGFAGLSSKEIQRILAYSKAIEDVSRKQERLNEVTENLGASEEGFNALSARTHQLMDEIRKIRDEYTALQTQLKSGNFKGDREATQSKIIQLVEKENALQTELNNNLVRQRETEKLMEQDVKDVEKAQQQYNSAIDQSITKTSQLSEMISSMGDEERMQKFGDVGEIIPSGGIVQTDSLIKNIVPSWQGILLKVADAVKKLGNEFLNLAKKVGGYVLKGITSKLKELGSSLFHIGKSSNSANGGFAKLGITMIKAMLGVRGLYMLMRKLRSAIVEGFNELAQFNGGANSTNYAIQSLKNSLTYLRNSWVAAFAPILEYVAPILTRLIDLLASAASAVAAFFATLTGKGTMMKAVKQQTALGGAAGGTAKKLKDEGEQAKKTVDRLAGFDDLDVLGKDDDDSKLDDIADDLGGGGGAGGAGALFEEVPVEMNKWLETDDWFDLGRMVAEKLNELIKMLDKWILGTFRPWLLKWAKRLATFINGFFSFDELFANLGKMLAHLTNVLAEGFNVLIDTINFNKIGEQIWRTIDNFINELDAKQIGNALANMWNWWIDTFEGFASNFADTAYKWGQKIGNILSNWAEHIHLDKLGTALGNFFNGISDVIQGFVDSGGLEKALNKITEGINNFLETFDVNKFANAVNSLIGKVAEWIEQQDWDKIGYEVGNALGQIDWGKLLISVGSAIAEAFFGAIEGAIAGARQTFVEKLTSSLGDAGNEGLEEKLAHQFGLRYDKGEQKGREYTDGAKAGVESGKTSIWDAVSSLFADTSANTEKGYADGNEYATKTAEGVRAGTPDVEQAGTELGTTLETQTRTAMNKTYTTTEEGILEQVGAVKKGTSDMSAAYTTMGEEASTNVSTAMDNINTTVTTKTGETLEQLSTNANLTVAELSTTLQLTTVEQMDALGEIILMAVGTVGEQLKTTITTLVDTISQNIMNKVTTTITQLQAKINTALILIKTKVTETFNFISNTIATSMSRASLAFVNHSRIMVQALQQVYEMIVKIISGLAEMSGALSGMGIDVGSLKTINVPHLAKGAVIPPNNKFLAMLGDQTSGTNIEAPLDTIVDAFKQVVGNMQVENTGYSEMQLDGEVFARLITPYVISELNREGYNVEVLEA